MIIGECISEEQVREFERIYNEEIKSALTFEPGLKRSQFIREDGGNMVVSVTTWQDRDHCLRYHSSRGYRQFIAKTQRLLLGTFVVKLFVESEVKAPEVAFC